MGSPWCSAISPSTAHLGYSALARDAGRCVGRGLPLPCDREPQGCRPSGRDKPDPFGTGVRPGGVRPFPKVPLRLRQQEIVIMVKFTLAALGIVMAQGAAFAQ